MRKLQCASGPWQSELICPLPTDPLEEDHRKQPPHTVFSLSLQPINTESVPKNVVDTVSDSRRGGVGVEGNRRKMHLGKGNSCVWGHPSGVDLGNLREVVGTWMTLQAGQLTSLCSEMDC